MEECYIIPSKYGSKKITDTGIFHSINAVTIEILTDATFTSLRELGYVEIGAGVAQVDTITLTGSEGTANVTEAGGLTKLATWNTSLTQTATDFVTAHAAAYAAVGITLTSSTVDLIFTAIVEGTPFIHPVITNVTPDLAGTVVNTTPNTPTPLSYHGIFAAVVAGEKLHSRTEFTGVEISAGSIVVY